MANEFGFETNERIQALAKHLDEETEDLQESTYDETVIELGSQEYSVLTDDEADEKAEQYIADSLWAFNASFLSEFTDLPIEVFEAMQGKCEGSNDAILRIIERTDEGLEGFVQDAISADGRGHFLSGYDGYENEETINGTTYYIYRTN